MNLTICSIRICLGQRAVGRRFPRSNWRQVEVKYPRAWVTSISLTPEPGKSLFLGVEARVDPANVTNSATTRFSSTQVAFTAFSMNLYSEVFYPVLSTISKVTPSPFELRKETDQHQPIQPKIGFAEIIQRAAVEAKQRGWTEPSRQHLLLVRIWHLRRKLCSSRRRPRCRRSGAGALILRQQRRPRGRRPPAVKGHGGGYLRPSAVSAALWPYSGLAWAYFDFLHGPGGCPAERNRRRRLVEKTRRAPARHQNTAQADG
jgi:hypothetical protein